MWNTWDLFLFINRKNEGIENPVFHVYSVQPKSSPHELICHMPGMLLDVTGIERGLMHVPSSAWQRPCICNECTRLPDPHFHPGWFSMLHQDYLGSFLNTAGAQPRHKDPEPALYQDPEWFEHTLKCKMHFAIQHLSGTKVLSSN